MTDTDLEKMVAFDDKDRLVADAKHALSVGLRLQVELIKAIRNLQHEMMENRIAFVDICTALRERNDIEIRRAGEGRR